MKLNFHFNDNILGANMVRCSIIRNNARAKALRDASLKRIIRSQGRNTTPLNLNCRHIFNSNEKNNQALLATCKNYSGNVPQDSLAKAHADFELWGKYYPLRGLQQAHQFTQERIDEIKKSRYIAAIIPVPDNPSVNILPGSLVYNFNLALMKLVSELQQTRVEMEFYGLDPKNWHISIYGITLNQEGIEDQTLAEYVQPVKAAVTAAFASSKARSLTIDFWGLNVGITPSGIAVGFRGYPRNNSLLLRMRDYIEQEIKKSGRRLDEGFRLRLITYLIGLRIFPRESMDTAAINSFVDFMSKYADTYFGTMSQIHQNDILIRKGLGPAMVTIEETPLIS